MGEMMTATRPDQPDTFVVVKARFTELEAEIVRLNVKALKLGLDPLRLTVLEEFVKEHRVPVGPIQWVSGQPCQETRIIKVTHLRVRLEGAVPVLAGWSFIAEVESTPAGPLYRKAIGSTDEIPHRYREPTRAQDCEHCKLRRRRNYTYIVRQGDEWMQVGHSCLKDFIGKDTPASIAARFKWFAAIRESMEGYGSVGRCAWPTMQLLATTLAVMQRRGGFVSAQSGGLTPTASEVMYAMGPPDKEMRPLQYAEWVRDAIQPNEVNYTEAESLISTLLKLTAEGASDYEHNLRTVALNDYITSAWVNLAVSIPYYVARQCVEPTKVTTVAEHFGTVGQRYDLSLRVTHVIPVNWHPGAYWQERGHLLHIFADEQGRAYKWWSNEVELAVGDWYNIRATVKAHEEYRGVPQTVLTRLVPSIDVSALRVGEHWLVARHRTVWCHADEEEHHASYIEGRWYRLRGPLVAERSPEYGRGWGSLTKQILKTMEVTPLDAIGLGDACPACGAPMVLKGREESSYLACSACDRAADHPASATGTR